MCDFCENIETYDEDKLCCLSCGILYNEAKKKYCVAIQDSEYDFGGDYLEVNYCPLCGRKLSEETEKMCDTDIAYMSGASVYKGDNGKGLLVADFWCSNCHKEYVGEIMRDGFVCECGKKIKMG